MFLLTNCNDRFLDLSFVNFPEIAANRCLSLNLPKDLCHPPICVSFKCKHILSSSNALHLTCSNIECDFSKANILLIKTHLSHISLSILDVSAENMETWVPHFIVY